MLVDARFIDNNSLIEGDICIIGAGAAGISMALDWDNLGYKVILLEGGGFEYKKDIQELYRGNITGQNYFPLMSSRLHVFGGTTGLWGGYCAKLDAIDFKKRDYVEFSGWPINLDDLNPFYDRAYKLLDLKSKNFDFDYWSDKIDNLERLPLDSNIMWSKVWQFSPPTRFSKKYKDAIINSKNITLYTFANVVNLSANDNVTRIEEVLIRNHAPKEHLVRANYFILACSAIQNARVLLNSNSQSKSGIGNEHDLVGRFFMEHLELKCGELWCHKDINLDLYIHEFGSNRIRTELALTEQTLNQHEILNGTIGLTPLAVARNNQANIQRWKNENPRDNYMKRSFIEKIRNRLGVLNEHKIRNILHAYEMFIRIEQSPNPQSRITLDKNKDALGMRRANLHWDLTAFNKMSIRKTLEVMGAQLGYIDSGRVRMLDYLINLNDDEWPDFTGGGWHHIGTTKMNNNPRKGVVDSNCQVHGVDNLFVAGSSCFPTAGAVNPTFSLIALSLRLSSFIKNRIEKDKIMSSLSLLSLFNSFVGT